jgi:hypothetical protein
MKFHYRRICWVGGIGLTILVVLLTVTDLPILLVAAIPALASWLLRAGTAIGGKAMNKIQWG